MKAAKKDKATRILRLVGGLALAGVTVTAGFILYVTLSLGPTLPDVEPLARDSLSGSRGQPEVALAAVPPVVTRAFIVADDPTFLEHDGMHSGSLIRLFATRVYDPSAHPRSESSLELRLARALLGAHDQHKWPRFSGALREVMLAVQLETGLTKNQLFAAYLNNIAFGPGVHGVVDAASEYFRKPLAALTVTEAATLAAMPRVPSNESLASSQATRERRRRILEGLLAAGVITTEQHDRAVREGGEG